MHGPSFADQRRGVKSDVLTLSWERLRERGLNGYHIHVFSTFDFRPFCIHRNRVRRSNVVCASDWSVMLLSQAYVPHGGVPTKV